ncbi:hypothetical protein EMPS_10773 [Entomortierella parvispora]|uniref:Uncharacterized protein n=1 Tax=Entomortierella parvispora TaxID=205924 RepID=A0A9P3M1H9_9FUNG|nr:hypothetical protein EMPS_10773 [Entomortierella parvispora]
MASLKSSLFLVLVLAGFLCLLQTSQAVCTIELQSSSSSYPEDICFFSLPDCGSLLTETDTMDPKYGLLGITVTPISVSRMMLKDGDTMMVKAALEPYLQGCYNIAKGALTLYGKGSA